MIVIVQTGSRLGLYPPTCNTVDLSLYAFVGRD